jgi:hypothetical protein
VIFPIRLERRLWPILLLFGVRPGAAFVRLDGDRVVARFGFFRAETPLANIERWDITGPYRWWRAVGVRSSPGMSDLTFGGSAHGGVCLYLRAPMRVARFFRVREFYVTVDDLKGLAQALSARGIPGEDRRTPN